MGDELFPQKISTAFRELELSPPLPIGCSNWDHGWLGVAPPEATTLKQARQSSLGKLFVSGLSPAFDMEETAMSLMRYAALLRRCCTCQCPFKASHRRTPIVFAWTFPAETTEAVHATDLTPQHARVTMRSAYIAFEFSCVCVASAILFGRAGMAFHIGSHGASHVTRTFRAAINCLDHMAGSSSTFDEKGSNEPIFGRGQWARLRRQQLPLQLQAAWQGTFRKSLCHRYHLCSSLGELAPEPVSVVDAKSMHYRRAVLRGSEESALGLVLASRWGIIDEAHMGVTQVAYCHDAYHVALRHLLQLRAHGCLEDAELALEAGLLPFANALLQIGKRAWPAFDKDDPNDKAVVEQLQIRHNATELVLRACPGGCATGETDEAAALTWRSELPVFLREP